MRRLREVGRVLAACRLIRLAVGVSLAAVMTALAAVATLVRRQLRIAVRADQPQVLPTVVRRVPVDVVHHQRKGLAEPRVRRAADRATIRLSLGEKQANVMALVAVHSRRAGFKPHPGSGIAPGRRLTCITAVDLLAALREWRTATATLSHAATLRRTTDNQRSRNLEPPIGIEPMAYALQVRCSTTELRGPAGLSLSGPTSGQSEWP